MSIFWLVYKDNNENISDLENIGDLELLLIFQLVCKDENENENENIGHLELLLKIWSVYNNEVVSDVDLEFDSSDDTWEVNVFLIDYHYPNSHLSSSEHNLINELSTNQTV